MKENDKISALQVAQYIINHYTATGKPISNLPLQKLLYVCSKQYVCKTGRKLFPETFDAFAFGPAVRVVYYEYYMLVAEPIQIRYDVCLPADVRAVIDPILNQYTEFYPWTLDDECRDSVYDSAWQQYINELAKLAESTVPVPCDPDTKG